MKTRLRGKTDSAILRRYIPIWCLAVWLERKRRDLEHGKLLNLATELGYQLMVSGAEIYRTEDSVGRLMKAYGLDSGEVFAIPNCLTVSLRGEDGEPITRIRRIPEHGTCIEMLERYNALCRELCRETPELDDAMARLKAVPENRKSYPRWVQFAACFVAAAAFCLFFGGSLTDAPFSGICGIAVSLCLLLVSRVGANGFFKTIAASAVSALLAMMFDLIWPGLNTDAIIIGAYMALVPGVAFTTALRDLMAGDMVSGLAKAAEGVLIAVGIAVGTGVAMSLVRVLTGG